MKAEVTVARGAASLYLASIITLVLNTVYFVILTNILSPPVVGFVSLVNVLILGVATLASLALPVGGTGVSAAPPAATRFISQYIAEGRGNAAWRLFAISGLIAAAVAVPIAVILSLPQVSLAIASPLSPRPIVFGALDAVFLSLGQVGAFSLIGAGRPTRAGAMVAIAALVKYLVASSLLFLGWGASGVFIGFSAGDFVLAVSTMALSSRSIPRAGTTGIDRGAVASYMLSVLASGIIGYGVAQTDRLLAFLQRGFSDLAVYNAASVGAAVAAFAPAAVTNVLVPILSAQRGQEASQRKELLRSFTRYVSLVSSPMGFGLAAIAPSLLLLFGEKYASGTPLMAVMGISISLTAVSSVYSSSLLAGRRTSSFLLGNCLALVSLAAVSFALVPLVGLLGVALGRSVMFFVAAIAFAFFARLSGEFALDLAGYLKSLAASAAMGGVLYVLLVWAESSLIHTRLASVLVGVLLIPVGLGLYIIGLRLLGAFSERDLEFAEQLLPAPLARLVKRARRFLL